VVEPAFYTGCWTLPPWGAQTPCVPLQMGIPGGVLSALRISGASGLYLRPARFILGVGNYIFVPAPSEDPRAVFLGRDPHLSPPGRLTVTLFYWGRIKAVNFQLGRGPNQNKFQFWGAEPRFVKPGKKQSS